MKIMREKKENEKMAKNKGSRKVGNRREIEKRATRSEK